MTGSVAAIVVAAGRGARAGAEIPKQYRAVGGEMVIRRCLALFANCREITEIQPVIHPDDAPLFTRAVAGLKLRPPVSGGATRQTSVRLGLEALALGAPDIVLVHDAARPFATAALVTRAIETARRVGAAAPALPLTDTIKTVDAAGRVLTTLDRRELRAVQTPQAFRFGALFEAHRRAAALGRDDFSDDAALAEWAGMEVGTFEGEVRNIKLTTAEDFARAEAEHMAPFGDVRTGNGFDVHVFGEGNYVMLGGVRIPHTHSLLGHSDADVGLHALTDAILGALADGDIGSHFPPSDPQWHKVSSDRFLAFAAECVHKRGGIIANLDVTFVCEQPRIGPHRDAMRARIAAIAGVAPERVAVKGTTTENLGFTGRGEGIAAFATATVRLPWSGP